MTDRISPAQRSENSMKIIGFFTLVIVGVILVTGCVGQIKNTTISNNTTIKPENSFIPFSNETNLSNLSDGASAPLKTGLNGSLRISIGGLDAVLPVSVDGKTIGNVTKVKPLDLMLEEGNHTVEVCCGILCESENVTVKFGKQPTLDFSEKIEKDCQFFEPTARITDYSQNGNHMYITVEFINPTAETHTISAEITAGYSYIDDRSNNRVGNFANGFLSSTLKPGDDIEQTLDLNLYSSGSSYLIDIPVLSRVSST